jgi:hypothetical protein
MAVTPADVRRWLFRHIQYYVGWFDSPVWHAHAGEFVPALVKAIERLGDHVAALEDDNPHLLAISDALNRTDWTPGRLHEHLDDYILRAYGMSPARYPTPEELVGGFTRSAVGLERVRT